MDDSVRSDGVVKKKNSSGCLIIKKKGRSVDGVGIGSSKEKKRPSLEMSDSGSSDESLETLRQKVGGNFHNGGVEYRRSGGEDSEFRRNGEFECERKRSRMDLFEFDEYDEFEGKKVRNEYADDDGRLKMVGRSGGTSQEFGGSESRRGQVVEKRKLPYLEGSSSLGSGRSKGVEYGGGMSKVELDEAEAQLPISLLSLKYQEMPEEPIRFQGKNGVLKVMVNKNKKTKVSRHDYDREHRKGSRSEVVVKKEPDVRPPFYLESKRLERRMPTLEREKSEYKTRKPLLGKNNMDDDFDLDETDTSLKLAPPSLNASSSSKAKKQERSSSTENILSRRGKEANKSSTEPFTSLRRKEEKGVPTGSSTPARSKEGKVKQRGGSTEKQQLREKIREMLIKAGWTIDYRPRRNRDYLDAVYINPSGTAYWSIIKAYDALQKQLNDQQGKNKSVGTSSSFAPLSEDLISKLTRQTRKKIEEEMKKKRREDGISKTGKRAAINESGEGTDSDQPEETLSAYLRQNRKSSKDKMHESDHESGDESSDNSCKRTPREDRVEKLCNAAKNRMVHGRKSRKIGRCTLLVRNPDKGQNFENDGYVPYTGKRTVLAWLIDSGTVRLSEKVQYMNRRRTRVKLEGWITRDGIHCGCCSKILAVSKFELHAGSKLRRPFQNIFLESGVSLLQCQIDAWNQQEESERQDFHSIHMDGDDPDDDTCGICGDGGDLICCDSCPSTFHQSCLEIQMLPLGDWHCPNCICKFCSTSSRNVAEDDALPGDELTICSLCESKYHKLCSVENGAPTVESNNAATLFCSHKCQELYEHLQKILGVKHELESGFSWSLIQRTDLDSDVSNGGFAQRVECNSKLAVALSVMDECFLPIVDRRSGINLIHNVLYNCGANFRRLNYCGFYTAVLERGDEIISVASIRIHGTRLAEMPFIGTRHIYRRQGMCCRLLSAIESVLSSLKVEKLIIPAISEHMHTWTAVFGFIPLEEYLKRQMKSMNMLVFPGTDMLQKQLVKQSMADGIKAVDLTDSHSQLPALMRKSCNNPSIENGDMLKDDKVGNVDKKLHKVVVDSGSSDSAAPSNSSAPSALDSSSKSDMQFSNMETALGQSKQVLEFTSSMKASSLSASSTSLLGLEYPADPRDKECIQSSVETGELPRQTVESFDQDTRVEAMDNQNFGAQNLVEMENKSCSYSGVASEVNTKNCDITVSSLKTGQAKNSTDENGSTSILECGDKEPFKISNSDLSNLGVDLKDELNVPPGLGSNTEAANDAKVASMESAMAASGEREPGNRNADDVGATSIKHAGAYVGSNASKNINEMNHSCSPCGGAINSESHVKMLEVKSELPDASGLRCDVHALATINTSNNFEDDTKGHCVQAISHPDNICLPHGAENVNKNVDAVVGSTTCGQNRLNPLLIQQAISEVESDVVTSKVISREFVDPVEATLLSNGKGNVIPDEVAVEGTFHSDGEGKMTEPSQVGPEVACEKAILDSH